MSGGGGLQFLKKHLLICISFCMEIQNLKCFPLSVPFSFSPVYYSAVTLLTL